MEKPRKTKTEGAGVDEDTIQRLHTYDWAQINKERQYRQNQTLEKELLDQVVIPEFEEVAESVDDLPDSIENQQLLHVLSIVDKLTLQILLYKVQGFTRFETSLKIHDSSRRFAP